MMKNVTQGEDKKIVPFEAETEQPIKMNRYIYMSISTPMNMVADLYILFKVREISNDTKPDFPIRTSSGWRRGKVKYLNGNPLLIAYLNSPETLTFI